MSWVMSRMCASHRDAITPFIAATYGSRVPKSVRSAMVRIERKTILGAMTLLTIALFVLTSAAIVWTWNRFFQPVSWRVAITLWLICAAYQATTLFTPRVDLPGNLAYVAYPCQA